MPSLDRSQLEKELKQLSKLLDWGYHLKVRWEPRRESPVEGEVKDNTVLIYSQSLDEAVRTLRHEFLDALYCEGVKTYEDIINIQRITINTILKQLQDRAYKKKEGVIETLGRLLDNTQFQPKRSARKD